MTVASRDWGVCFTVRFLPEKITERREMLGQTIAELADTLGFSARTLRAWEEGINKPKNENLLKILAWLEDTSTVS